MSWTAIVHPLVQTGGMNTKSKSLLGLKPERLIAKFGPAKLVSLPDGTVELRDARAEDRTTAKEWISIFMHEAVPRFEAPQP